MTGGGQAPPRGPLGRQALLQRHRVPPRPGTERVRLEFIRPRLLRQRLRGGLRRLRGMAPRPGLSPARPTPKSPEPPGPGLFCPLLPPHCASVDFCISIRKGSCLAKRVMAYSDMQTLSHSLCGTPSRMGYRTNARPFRPHSCFQCQRQGLSSPTEIGIPPNSVPQCVLVCP